MNKKRTTEIAIFVALTLATLMLAATVAGAQSIQGVINGRSGATMTVQTQDAGNVVVVLNDYTQVEDVSGLFHARKKQMG